MIGARVKIVVVSLGADGAAACDRRPRGDGRRLRRRPLDRHHRRGRPVRRRLGVGRRRRASRSTTPCAGPRSTRRCPCASRPAPGGATHLGEFMDEGARRGLPTPPAGVTERTAAAEPAAREVEVRRLCRQSTLARRRLVVRSSRAAAAPRRRRRADTPTPARPTTDRHARARPPCAHEPEGAQGRHGRRHPAATELSGLARARDGRFWTHNDSGDGPRVFALDRRGRAPARGRRSRAPRRSTGRTSRSAAARSTSATSATTSARARTSPSTGSRAAGQGSRAPGPQRIDPALPGRRPRRRGAARRPAHRRARRSSPRTSAASPGVYVAADRPAAQGGRRSTSASGRR